jgi:tRNA(Ile)-lysidine synthase
MAATRRLKQLGEEVLVAADTLEGTVAVALSGGADSAVLLWVALQSGASVRALHIHHGLPASEQLSQAASAIASALGATLDVRYVEHPAGGGPGSPAAAIFRSEGELRTSRYHLMLGELKSGEWLATGHTADDQAETVLANLLRGSGLEGLSGIPRRRFPLSRPLLGVYRAQTRELATLMKLPWVEDPSNLELGPLRNRIRHRLLPQLESEYNPNLRRRLSATADLMAAEAASIEEQLVPVYTRGSGVRLAAGLLRAVGKRRAGHSIREAMRRLHPPYPPSGQDVATAMAVLEGRAGRSRIGGNVEVLRSGPWLEFTAGQSAPFPPQQLWPVPGHLTWGEFELEGVVGTDPPTAFPLSSWLAVLDADKVGDVLTVHSAGSDEMDLLAKAGIAADRRACWPVVEGKTGIVWIPGLRTYATGWVESGTDRYLSLACREEQWNR